MSNHISRRTPRRIYINHKGLAYLIGNFPLRTPTVRLSPDLTRTDLTRPLLHFKRKEK